MASDGSLGGHEVAEKSVHIGNAAAVIQRAPGDPTETQATSTGRIAFVREDNLNLRIGPGQQTKSLMQLRFGQRVHLLDSSDQAGWRKVAVLGQTGYVYAHGQRIHFPDESLINKDPGLSLIKVKSNQSFWGLVKEVYGIQGNETTADQNINHFINAIKAINKPSAFRVKAGLLDKVGNAFVSGRDASDTELIENVDLWIPSYHVAAKMDVGSGTVTGEVSRFVKKIDQKLADFSAACGAAKKFIPGAIGRNASAMAEGLLTGLIDFALDAAKILATSTAVGALIGALFGGVGAIPGAEIGFEIGLFILNCYGIYMLVEAVLGVAGSLLSQLGKFISLAWNANGDKEQIEAAGKALAEALGVLVSAVLMALAAYVLKKGSEALLKTKFAKTVGESRLAQWLKERQTMTTTKEQLEKSNRLNGESSEHQKENGSKAERGEEDKFRKEEELDKKETSPKPFEYSPEVRRLAKKHGMPLDEAVALQEHLMKKSTKGVIVGEDDIARHFGVKRNAHKLPEFMIERKDGLFSAVEVKNQNVPEITHALEKFRDVAKLSKEKAGAYRMGRYEIYVKEGFKYFDDPNYVIGKDGALTRFGAPINIDGVPVHIEVRNLGPSGSLGGK
jgi:hypothetical protein